MYIYALCNLTKNMHLSCKVPIRHNFMSLFWLIFQVSGTAPSVTTQPSTIIEEGDFAIGGHPYTTLTKKKELLTKMFHCSALCSKGMTEISNWFRQVQATR